MQSKATTASAYLKQLPADRKPAIEAVRKAILAALPKGYEEGMQYGHIGYYVPHSVYPPGYHCDPSQPLPFVAIANQKQHMAVYMMGLYCGCVGNDETPHVNWFRDQWAKTGKKLDMGKSCIRFKKLEDLALDVIAEAVRRQPAQLYIDVYEKSLADQGIVHKGKKALLGAKGAAAAPKKASSKPASRPAGKKVTKKVTKKVAKKSASKTAARTK
jgi:hypothetical protein